MSLPEEFYLIDNLLKELLIEGLIKLEEYKSVKARNPDRIVEPQEYSLILDNFYNWFPNSTPAYSIAISEKGENYLNTLPYYEAKSSK